MVEYQLPNQVQGHAQAHSYEHKLDRIKYSRRSDEHVHSDAVHLQNQQHDNQNVRHVQPGGDSILGQTRNDAKDENLNRLRNLVAEASGVKDDKWISQALCDFRLSSEKTTEHRQVTTQRRSGQKREGKAEEKDVWRTDTHGPVQPPSWQRMRYFIVLRCLLTRYVMCYGMTTKHSSWVRLAYEKFASTLHRLPKGVERDGGREYLAEAEAWERERNIYASDVSEAY